MATVSLVYGTRIRRSDFFVKVGTQIVCRNGHPKTTAEFIFCPTCGKKYVTEDVLQPTSHIERLMHESFVSRFDDWWDGARGDLLDGDPGVCVWRVDPVQREGDYPRIERDWDSATFALGVRLTEFGSSDTVANARLLTVADLGMADHLLRETFPRWGVPANSECHLYPVLMVR